MERYIERLKNVDQTTRIAEVGRANESEKINTHNPCVVSCVTMGKEPHVGHLLLLTMAEQMHDGLGSSSPVYLINNNTGPRAAGALVNIAKNEHLSLEAAATAMGDEKIDVPMIVSAYRARNEDAQDIGTAMKILEERDVDIFSRIAKETEKVLAGSGYSMRIVSGATLIKMATERNEVLSPEWSGSGFLPIFGDRKVVVLQKSGNLTSSGALLASMRELSRQVGADLLVIVDSLAEAGDVALVQSTLADLGKGVQVLGAGIGFGGEIASGTGGEAMSIKELASRFLEARPGRSLKQAMVFLTLVVPVSLPVESRKLSESFYDFKDNQSLLRAIIKCSDEVAGFKDKVIDELSILSERVGDVTTADSGLTKKFLEYLPLRANALFTGEAERVLAEAKKVTYLNTDEEVHKRVAELGYAENMNPYVSGKRALGLRQNYYYNYMSALVKTMHSIVSLQTEEFLTIGKMAEHCLIKMGI